MKRSMLVLAIAACAAIASPSTTSARLSDLTETRQAQPNYAQYYYGPYRRHVRRVYRRGYRRASYGYPYYYGGILSTLFLWRILSSVLISGHVGMCVECIVVHKKPFGQMRAR